jgi:hypothetical protein
VGDFSILALSAMQSSTRCQRASFRVPVNALALNGEMHQARLALLNIYTRPGRYKEARQQISMCLDAKPDAPNREQLMAITTKIETALSQ